MLEAEAWEVVSAAVKVGVAVLGPVVLGAAEETEVLVSSAEEAASEELAAAELLLASVLETTLEEFEALELCMLEEAAVEELAALEEGATEEEEWLEVRMPERMPPEVSEEVSLPLLLLALEPRGLVPVPSVLSKIVELLVISTSLWRPALLV